jgi:hypothetical protein
VPGASSSVFSTLIVVKNTLKVLPLCPLGRMAYSIIKKEGYEDWKAAVFCVAVGYTYLVLVKI